MQETEINNIVNEVLNEFPELFTVLVKIKGNDSNQRITVLIDGEPSFTIDQCAKVSRKISAILEEKDIFSGKYTLEVSSPGVDYPLMFPRQYHKNVGRNVRIETVAGETLEGKLAKSDEEGIDIEFKKTNKRLAFNEIKKTNIIVSFN